MCVLSEDKLVFYKPIWFLSEDDLIVIFVRDTLFVGVDFYIGSEGLDTL